MRFALTSLSIYLLIHVVGSAMAEMGDFEYPQAEMEIQAKKFSGFVLPYEEYQVPNNIINCQGYLTNNPSEDFCSDTVPEEWRPFEFNGEVIYAVPLRLAKPVVK